MTIQTTCLQTFLCLSLALTALPPATFAQPTPADTISAPAARAAIFYQSCIGRDAAIYNGLAYQPNYRGIQGDPYYLTTNLTDGTIDFEGLTYTHIPLLYDLVHDQLIISDPTGQLLITPAGKLRQFTLSAHTFTCISVDKTPGYYEILQPGRTALLVHRTKTIDEKIESAELRRSISSHDVYYLYKQGQYYRVQNGKHLLTLLDDKQKQLRQFQHASHIRFKKDPESAMKAIIGYYNQLLQQPQTQASR